MPDASKIDIKSLAKAKNQRRKVGKEEKEEEKKQNLIYGDGPVARAYLKYYANNSKDKKDKKTIPVQFNPGQLSIARGMKYSDTTGVSEDTDSTKMQAVKPEGATLSVELFVDSASIIRNMTKSDNIDKFIGKKGVTTMVEELSNLMKYEHDNHVPLAVKFCWGRLIFKGVVSHLTVNYQMFDREGTPVQARITLEIQGEEEYKEVKSKSQPKQSPDRTKYRNLGQADELWMMAYDEYSDAGEWRQIAMENEILNPRKMDHTKMLKVPSI